LPALQFSPLEDVVKKPKSWKPLALSVAIASAGIPLIWVGRSSVADDPAEKTDPPATGELALREFMRLKLEASGRILEGLSTDDLDLVRAGASDLHEMSNAERWRVSADPLYRQFSGDFREATQQLMQAADDRNPDRAAMKWIDATMCCLDCHRFVRGMRIAEVPAGE
jgi:hypothetical protein